LNFQSRVINCAWHIQRNIVKHLSGLAKKDKPLYQKALALPFISRKRKFEEYIDDLQSSSLLSTKEKNYLKELLSRKERWARSVIKSSFGGGISTSSRIEGLHVVLKRFLNSRSSLQNVFYSFREIEDAQLEMFSKEIYLRKAPDNIKDINFIKELEENYSEYIVKKIT